MPTVLRAQGFRLYFWSREPNEPSHVHVDRGGASAKVRLVRERKPELLEAWHDFFGAD